MQTLIAAFLEDFNLFITFILPKIITATICGLIIGYDREVKSKVAGIRTMILICAGCSVYTCLSTLMMGNNVDPTRIVGQIATGIGFLGAGVIMKNEDKIVGVTTAAFIWVVSVIGIFIGLNWIVSPILMSLGLVFTSRIFEGVEKSIHKNIEK
ncbi:MgtC/SapB family protein [bacterium]|nr:MgtC/SapB family protein [bacterium]